MHVVQDLAPSTERPGEGLSAAARQKGLEQVLRNPAIWRAQQAHPVSAGLSTGWPALDHVLPDSGWPAAALTELLVGTSGAGELSLLMPTLRAICAAGKGIALIGAPYLPQARAWEEAGIALERLLIIDAEGNDALWAAEQVLRSGECGAVLLWGAAVGRVLNHRALQRLQLAANNGNALCFLYRPVAAETSPSPAPLRLRLAAQAGDLNLQVVKCRGTARVKAVRVQTFPAHWNTSPSAVSSFAASAAAAPAVAEAAKAPTDTRRPVTVQLSLV
ncbi:MAG TPA: translesion DNA synthesis-associated protein ImuA [Pseudomonadales bacterium]